MKPVFKTFVDDEEIPAPKSGWEPIVQKTVIENFNKDKKYSFKTLKEVIGYDTIKPTTKDTKPIAITEETKEEIPVVEDVEEVEEVVAKSLIDMASEHITQRAKLKEADSFQQPVAPDLPNNLADINKRVRYLEQWLAKVSMDGPGSGEVRFMNLDDVDKASFADRDTHKLLRYKPDPNPAFDSVYFDFLSGDQGPIYSMKYDVTGYTANANVAPGLTYYDPERDTLEILHKDGSATYTGLDNYIRITNNGSANTIPRGSLVQFAGVEEANLVPYVSLFVANATATPLLAIGLTATELPSNTLGRAILLGEIEDLDTSGATVGEVWQTGDLLWAHPSIPGALTKNKPTAPNVVVSVAAVLSANSTSGHLLVRPTIWPRLRYADIASFQQQKAGETNVDRQVSLANVLINSGFTLTGNTITVADSGLYKFDFRCQISSTSGSSKSIIVWYKKNGVNVPFSSVRVSSSENGGFATVTNTQLISLLPTDNVTIHFTVNNTDIFIDSPAVFNGAANIPAVQLSITEAAL